MNVSFVIYFHSSRLDNLKQAIRFLEKREYGLYGSEMILVCQDSSPVIQTKFNTKHVNLLLGSYNKAIMCNYGINIANGDIIILLDSDRILPPSYFCNCVSSILPRQFITTKFLYSLNKNYDDDEIDYGRITRIKDFRSVTNESVKKNLFSGNTVFYKRDYIGIGYMDESFVGYGYLDNDQTRKVISNGYNAVYLNAEELHLYHDRCIYWNNTKVNNFKIVSAINAIKYFKKWNIPIDCQTANLINGVRKDINLFDEELVNIFKGIDSRRLI